MEPAEKMAVADAQFDEGKGVHDSEQGIAEVFIDPNLEARVITKFDRFLMPQMALMVIIAYLDRSNLGNVLSTCCLFVLSKPSNHLVRPLDRQRQDIRARSRPRAFG